MKFDSTKTILDFCVVAVLCECVCKRKKNVSLIYYKDRNINQITKKIYVQNNLDLLQPQHITMQQCLLSMPMEYKSTFPSTPFSSKHRELAKIQHHVRMDHTTCNNERYRIKIK